MKIQSLERGRRRPWAAEILWLLGLVAFFFLSYGFASWFTGRRHNVPSISFAWERQIPFLAWTIVPYWSTDVFYAVSFFLCRTRKELGSHVRRLLAAQIISVSCYLVFPLRFSFPHPDTSGLFGWLFHALGNFDGPYNQLPSLHLSLITILWVKFLDHSRGLTRVLLRCWFVLMGISTLTTYQHHFIDVLPGIGVGLLCVALFPDHRIRAMPSLRSARIASFYLVGGFALAFVGWWFGDWEWLLFWPAIVLCIVAAAYLTGSPEIFQESDGRMEPTTKLLLAPYIAVRRMHARWWTRGELIAQEIADGVWLGRLPGRQECPALRIASIVNVAAELPADSTGVVVRSVPMLDLVVPTVDQLDAAVARINDLTELRPTLVCCALGYSRSAVVIAAWLVASDLASSVEEAVSIVQARRPTAVLTPGHQKQLHAWARTRVGSWPMK